MQSSTLAKRAWPLFFLAVIALYFYGIGAVPFMGPDEPRYAQVAREMFAGGDMVTPTLGGRPWFEKPALLYWMEAASFAAFGVSEWAARLGPACAGLLTILFVYRLGRSVERRAAKIDDADDNEADDKQADDNEEARAVAVNSREAAVADKSERAATVESKSEPAVVGLGWWSALALASSAGLITFSRALSFDVLVTMTMTGALACFFIYETESRATGGRRRGLLLAGFFIFIGASLLAKGLIGIVLPGGIIFVYLLLGRRWPSKLLILSLLWGVPLALAVAALWYGPVIARHGWTFINEFFIQHHFARYVSNKYRHPGPIYYYIPVLLLMSLPWTAFLVPALFRARHWQWRRPDTFNRFRLFALSWLTVPFIFFTLSGSKLPGYLLPALPAAALLMGEQLSRVARGRDSTHLIRLTGLFLIALGVGGAIAARREDLTSMGSALFVVAPLIVCGLFSLTMARARLACLVSAAGAMLLSVGLAAYCVAGEVSRRESARELLRAAAARGYASAPVYEMHVSDRTAEFYADDRLVRGTDGDILIFGGGFQARDAAKEQGRPILVIIPIQFLDQLTAYRAIETEVLADNGRLAIVAVTVAPSS